MYEAHDHPAAIVGVALPAHKSSLLQAVENSREGSGCESHELSKLASGCLTAALQNIDNLHIRIGHLDSRRRCPEEGRAQSIALPKLMHEFPTNLRLSVP